MLLSKANSIAKGGRVARQGALVRSQIGRESLRQEPIGTERAERGVGLGEATGAQFLGDLAPNEA